jgi:hypothetical protein
MTLPDRSAGPLRFPVLLRHVPVARAPLAHAALRSLLPEPGQQWWELVDAAGDDGDPPFAVAVTAHDHAAGCVVLRAVDAPAPAVLSQVIAELLVALRSTTADRVVASRSCQLLFADALVRAGFHPRSPGDGCFELEL